MALKKYLEKNKNARLLFGKSEIEIIRKQLLGLELSASEKTRLSRDIRKKFEVIEEISRFRKEFKLKKSQEIKFLIEESEEVIKERAGNNLKRIILYGSYAEGKQNKNSDIDLAIELKNKKNSEKLRAEILGELSEKIDLHIYDTLPKKVKDQINKTGKIIFDNE
jgi:predicted nucleotidyltransferase